MKSGTIASLIHSTADAIHDEKHPRGVWTGKLGRYSRLFGCLLRQCVIRELMFRGNFLLRCLTHVIWLGLVVGFYGVVFRHTKRIGDWDQQGYLLFLGTFLTLNATVNCFFINGLAEMGESIRRGSLDYVLLKPIDEQFFLSFQRFDWALLPQVLFGIAMAGLAASHLESAWSAVRIARFFVALVAGVAILYSILLILASLALWTVRHQELFELWFLLLQFGNYPDDVYKQHSMGICLRILFWCIVPFLLAVNVPARYGAMLVSNGSSLGALLGVAALGLLTSRAFFRFALRRHCSVDG